MKKIKSKIFLKLSALSVLLIFSFALVSSVFAAQTPLVPCGLNGAADCTLCHLVVGFKNIYDYLLYTMLFPASILVIVVAGVIYIVSSGNKSLMEKAKTAFIYALAALVIALVAWLLVNAILNAVGFTNAGNWYTFTCDTTQSTGPGTTGPGGSTLPGSTGTGCAAVVTNAQSMLGWTYSQSNRDADGYADCSSLVSKTYTQSGCSSPGSNTDEMYPKGTSISQGDQSSLKAGDLLIYPGHVMICEDDGCNTIIHASKSKGSVVESNSSWVFNQSGLKVIRVSDFCSSC